MSLEYLLWMAQGSFCELYINCLSNLTAKPVILIEIIELIIN